MRVDLKKVHIGTETILRRKGRTIMSLDQFKDTVAQSAFGMTKSEAMQKGLCINCKTPPRFYSPLGRKEYGISGLCEFCFDAITTEPDDLCNTCEKPREFHVHHANLGECPEFLAKSSSALGD